MVMGPQLYHSPSAIRASGGSAVVNSDGSISLATPANKTATLTQALTPGQNETLNGLHLVVAAASSFNSNAGSSARAELLESTFTGTNGVGTHAGYYAVVTAAHSAGTIGHLHAGQFRVDITSTGGVDDGWAVRAQLQVTGAATITTGLRTIGAIAPVFSAAATAPFFYGLHSEQIVITSAVIPVSAGAALFISSGASQVNAGLQILPFVQGSTTVNAGVLVGPTPSGATVNALIMAGPVPTGTAGHTAGILVTTKGGVIGGQPTVGINTVNEAGVLAIQAGTNGGASTLNALLIWYRSSAALGFAGYTADTTALFGSHTKLATDQLMNSGNNVSGILLTTAGSAFHSGGIGFGNNSSQNGQGIDFESLSELTTIAAAATTDTTIQLPAGAILLAVNVRVTTVIPTAATFTVTGAGSGTTFNTAAISSAANSTDRGTAAGAFYNATAQAIRITPNLTPGANTGRVRVTIFYIKSTPPAQ